MKKIFSLCFLACGLIFTSCSSDEDPIPYVKPQLPGDSTKPIKTIVHSGNINNCYDWQFHYDAQRMVAADGFQYNSSMPNNYTSYLHYSTQSIEVTNSNTMSMKFALNANFNITLLNVNKDEYTFYYNEDNQLIKWEALFRDANFGAEVSRAKADITYTNGNISQITYIKNNDDPIIYTFTAANNKNINGLLPETMSPMLGCYGFEHLFYAGLLGAPSKNLVKTITVDYPEESDLEDYTLNFTYSTNHEGNTTLCTFKYNDEAVSVNYGY